VAPQELAELAKADLAVLTVNDDDMRRALASALISSDGLAAAD
jgi:hypothetical protein